MEMISLLLRKQRCFCRYIDVVVDKVGDFGDDPGSGWSVAGVSNGTKDYTLVRKSSVQSGNTDWSASSAGTSTDDSEWIVTERY